ncbi:class I SAM-dependent DNA methyltransferase [Sphingomonas sp. RS2018]
MRCLFTMFAEDVRLLRTGSFTAMLRDAIDDPRGFAPMLEELWRAMASGGYSTALRYDVRHFNGGLFADAAALPLAREEIGELHAAARHLWTDVEPAIFGALLEQALDAGERRRLGAHYTPRAYVERLVVATIIAPLRTEWESVVLGTVERERTDNLPAAIAAVRDFQGRLAATRVLDPACGTGNFLYVALELMKQLEGEVLETLAALGGEEALALNDRTVDPGNFLGIEINPRAAAIAELVLWIGYLQWHLKGGGAIADPVLRRFGNIRTQDALLMTDDGGTVRRADWPEADYIVGNPPFIGGKDLRARLGEGYTKALWKTHPRVNRSADLVMFWWNRAAELLTERGTRLKRFGFVTTNSITQTFSRRVIARHLDAAAPVHLAMAIGDHPWTKAEPDAAAVRIAMTVVAPGAGEGTVYAVTSEAALDSDQPHIALSAATGSIHADLTVGADVTNLRPLRANSGLSSRGMSLHGAGFLVSLAEATHLGLGTRAGLERHIRPYRNGRDLAGRARGLMVIDLFGLDERDVRQRFPEVYGHLLRTVKPDRQHQFDRSPTQDAQAYLDSWWIFGKPRTVLRPALAGLSRYIATIETAKHRVFQFLDASILPDNMLVCVASDDAFALGVLSSRPHGLWSAVAGGTLEERPRYSKSQVFDPFPLPDATASDRSRIADLAEELDDHRKAVLAEHGDLTLTTLYNLRDQVASNATLDMVGQDQRRRGRVDVIAELHRQIDAAVLAAYGWPAELTDEAMIARLVALNAERADEERRGTVRWLRPDYQLARAGIETLATARAEQIEAPLVQPRARKPAFPRDAIGQTAAVLADLRSGDTLTAGAIAARYDRAGRLVPRIEATLTALARLGHVAVEGGGYRLRRVA